VHGLHYFWPHFFAAPPAPGFMCKMKRHICRQILPLLGRVAFFLTGVSLHFPAGAPSGRPARGLPFAEGAPAGKLGGRSVITAPLSSLAALARCVITAPLSSLAEKCECAGLTDSHFSSLLWRGRPALSVLHSYPMLRRRARALSILLLS